ncbi:coadhesin-like isoform X1 [Amphiura filiformis]|uniref:coadhesin-like isoform X1 n=1 Tax=Amphiura filiformis TaxID=82378 RepID=UPI003B217ADA
MCLVYSYLLLMTVGFISILNNVKGNPVPADERIFCFQNHEPRGRYGPCDTPQVNSSDADGENVFDTPEDCCALVGQGGGYTPNRSGSRCTSCTSVLGVDENGGNPVDGSIDGGWSDWIGWTDCSVTCGEGMKTKTRTCTNPAPANGGRDCNGESNKEKTCDMGSCVVDGNWGNWGSYGICSATCGRTATQTRTRECDDPAPQNGGTACDGDSEQTRICPGLPNCPIDGGWSSWGVWSDCSTTCGAGLQVQVRVCNNPSPQYGGQDCPGDAVRSEPCNVKACPIPGGWSNWGEWSPSCSATKCNEVGLQLRQRLCDNPPPQNSGPYCRGSSYSSQPCTNTDACPVDGGWGEWGEYGECSETCGDLSQRTRMRECNNPAPRNGGLECMGIGVEAQGCDGLPPCPTQSPGSGCSDDEDADCQGSGSGTTPMPTPDPCSLFENSYSYDLCIQGEIDPPDVPGNEDDMAPTPTTATEQATQPDNPFDYSSFSSL